MTIEMKAHRPRMFWSAALAVVLLSAGCSKDPAAAKQEHFDRGEQFFADGKYAEAIIEYRNAVQIDAQFGQARHKLAEAYSRTGDAPNAFAEIVRAADLLPDTDVQLKAGGFLLLAERYDEAKARAESVLAREPDNTAALVLKANALAGSRDLDAAITEMERVIAADPNNGISYASLGAFELMRGNRTEAEAAYTKAVESDPQSAEAQMALGQYRLALNDRARAEAAFLRATELAPSNVLALRALTSLYLGGGEYGKAEPFLLRTIEQTKDAAARLLLADVYLVTSQLDLARTTLESLVSDKDGFAPAKLRLARLDYIAGRKAQAHAHLDELLEQRPSEVQGLILKGRLLGLERRWDEGLASFEAAVAADPKSDAAQFWLAAALASRGRTAEAKKTLTDAVALNPRHSAAQVLLSRLHLRTGERAAALGVAQQAVQVAPRSPDARAALVWALIGTRDHTRAEQELKKLSEWRGVSAEVSTLEGVLRLARRDQKGAEQSFVKALELQPESRDALSGLLTTQLAAGNVAAAESKAEEAVMKAPEQPDTLLLAARTYAAAKRFDRAEAAARKAIQIDPQRLDAYSLLGQIFIEQRRIDDAIKEFDELSKRQPTNVAAHTLVGIMYQATRRRADAKQRYEKAIAINPNAAVAANNLAWMHTEDGSNLDVALQLAQTAKAKLPNSPEVSHTLGYVYYLKGLYPSAIEALKFTVQKQPTVALYHHHLGMAYAKSGNQAMAKQALDRALKIDPAFAGAAEAKATLASFS